jgi:FKBP-type peptidyl-prolyl cis-trans isomerase SlyD
VTDQILTVADGFVVSLDYTLHLGEGDVIDSSAGGEPLEFLQGGSQIIPGLEQALYGMAVGDEKSVVVAPGDGYGHRDLDAFQQIPRDAFPQDTNLEPGMGIELVSNTGEPFVAFVAEVGPDNVVLDFNHPLAGATLHFDVQIAALRQATGEELAHGHAHSPGHEH